MLNYITRKLLNRCTIQQKNKQNTNNCIKILEQIKPTHFIIYYFIKKTRIGKWLEKRWTKNIHKQIACNIR